MIKNSIVRTVVFLRQHARVVCLLLGSLFVSLWTLLRFITTSSTFDLVGQQLLTHQWLTGHMSHAVIGTTNYLWKMFLLYTPLDLLPGSPRVKLVVLTLIVNIAALVLLVVVLEKLLRLFSVRITTHFYAAMVWLSLIAGSVFWIQFANSRNLEVVAGVWLIYLGIKLVRQFSLQRAITTGLLAAILFFSDPLQIYMTALPLLVYAAVRWYRQKSGLPALAWLVVTLLAAYVVAKVIVMLATALLGLQFSDGPGLAAVTGYSLTDWAKDLLLTGKSFVQLYEGGAELGRPVQLLNLVVVLITLGWFAWGVVKQKRYLAASCLIGLVLVIDSLVYLASGQAFVGGTSRYLIMTVPMLLVTFAVVGVQRFRKIPQFLLAAAIVANGIFLGLATTQTWRAGLDHDAHLASAVQYIATTKYPYAFASMDTALPADYYHPEALLLPLECKADGLVARSYLFFDESMFEAAFDRQTTVVPIILDGNSLRNYPHVCSAADIRRQLDEPSSVSETASGDKVLLFAPDVLTKLR